MIGEQAVAALAHLAGEWPYPALDEPQRRTWLRHLGEWSYEDFQLALTKIAQSGRWTTGRPTPSAFYETISAIVYHRAMARPALPGPPMPSPEERQVVLEENMPGLRQALEEASARRRQADLARRGAAHREETR